jgi:hypothetical protein
MNRLIACLFAALSMAVPFSTSAAAAASDTHTGSVETIVFIRHGEKP